jgi:hypothetical protein
MGIDTAEPSVLETPHDRARRSRPGARVANMLVLNFAGPGARRCWRSRCAKKDTVWVGRKLEAVIEFRGMTGEGMPRHARFKELKS